MIVVNIHNIFRLLEVQIIRTILSGVVCKSRNVYIECASRTLIIWLRSPIGRSPIIVFNSRYYTYSLYIIQIANYSRNNPSPKSMAIDVRRPRCERRSSVVIAERRSSFEAAMVRLSVDTIVDVDAGKAGGNDEGLDGGGIRNVSCGVLLGR